MGVYMKQDSVIGSSTARHSWFLDDSFDIDVLIVIIFLTNYEILLLTDVNLDCQHLQLFREGKFNVVL